MKVAWKTFRFVSLSHACFVKRMKFSCECTFNLLQLLSLIMKLPRLIRMWEEYKRFWTLPFISAFVSCQLTWNSYWASLLHCGRTVSKTAQNFNIIANASKYPLAKHRRIIEINRGSNKCLTTSWGFACIVESWKKFPIAFNVSLIDYDMRTNCCNKLNGILTSIKFNVL
jgi:hypothetical protein